MNNSLPKLPQIRGQYRFNTKIKNWFDVGGPAEILFRPADFADLQFFLKNLSPEIPLNIIGAASNVIIDDAGIAGIVIKLGAEFAEISHQDIANQQNYVEGLLAAERKPDFLIKAGGATLCANLANYCQIHGIGGLEFLATIPGSIGGAIAMNAGCYKNEIADFLSEVQSIDFKGNEQFLTAADCQFSYRHNHLAKNFIFTKGVFYGFSSTPEAIAAKIAEFKNNRELSQPIRAKTGGSTFKNPTIKSFQKIFETNLNQGLVVAECKPENAVEMAAKGSGFKRVLRTISKSRLRASQIHPHYQEPRTTLYKDIQRESGKPENAVEMAAKGRDFEKVLKAWELIDAIGFRGKKIGGAKFSEKHCNFLINESGAKAADLLALGENARKKVKEKFGIELEWEIKHLR